MIDGLTEIRADGMTWPVETYLDALRYQRVDPFDLPILNDAARVTIVTARGEVEHRTAGDVRWHEAIALRALDHSWEATPCRMCGDPCLNPNDDICGPCEDQAEPWW